MPNETFVVAIISPQRAIRDAVNTAIEQHPHAGAVWTLNEYPDPDQLTQIRDATGGCIVFLDFLDPLKARAIAVEVDRAYPMAEIVAVHLGRQPQDLLEFMQLGIRELISVPLAEGELLRVCERATRHLRRKSDDEVYKSSLYAFLPARPGSGATTIAVHSAAAAGRLNAQPTLLIDYDLRLGMSSFIFKLHNERSVLDALTYSEQMEKTLWDQMLSHRAGLDILGSAPFEFGRNPYESGAGALLDYARRRYGTICVDLPGEMRDHELETIHRAREIFLVCTSDLGTLHMAKRKVDFLRTLDVHSNVSIIMNRADARGAMPVRDVEELLQLPVRFTIPVAEKEILEATKRAASIEGNSAIASQFERIARHMGATGEAMEKTTIGRRFIDFFSVTPVREKAARR